MTNKKRKHKRRKKEMKKNDFLSTAHDFYCMDFFYFPSFQWTFQEFLIVFPYFLFLIAAPKIIFASQNMKKKMNSFHFLCACLPPNVLFSFVFKGILSLFFLVVENRLIYQSNRLFS
jgi:hypothetical protein